MGVSILYLYSVLDSIYTCVSVTLELMLSGNLTNLCEISLEFAAGVNVIPIFPCTPVLNTSVLLVVGGVLSKLRARIDVVIHPFSPI